MSAYSKRNESRRYGSLERRGDRHRRESRRGNGEDQLAQTLGWFSIGLGIAELVAPDSVARLSGVRSDPHKRALLRTAGIRELTSGVGILSQPRPARWLWSRVGGDVMDLALLASAHRAPDSDRSRLTAATAAVLGVTALDVLCAKRLSGGNAREVRQARQRQDRTVRVQKTVTINRQPDELYQYWRDFQNLPRFMRHLESVEILDARRSRWRAKAPAGMTVEWEAEITEDRPGELIAWRALEGSDVEHSGTVRFQPAPGGRGTEMRVRLQYQPPAGPIGRAIAKLFGEEPEQQIQEDLRRFKQLMETGEIPLSEGPGLWRPAQPPADPNEVRNLVGVE